MSTMYIKGRLIAGIPAVIVRRAMRIACEQEAFTHILFTEECKVSIRKAREMVTGLLEENFLELTDRPKWAKRSRAQWYKTTPKGLKLSNATGLPRIPRSKGEAMLANFLKRVEEVNAHPDYIYRVTTVIVSGSYARHECTLGDLDVFYGLEARFADSDRDRACQNRIEIAHAKGRRFSNIVEELYWPENEVRLHLKARTRGLSLHSLNEFFQMKKDENFAYQVLIGNAEAVAARLIATPPTL